jgi:hypothetical protein
MTYILAAQRDGSPAEMRAGFQRYREYLEQSQSLFPRHAFALATSGWYYGFGDHRCPHEHGLRRSRSGKPKRARVPEHAA